MTAPLPPSDESAFDGLLRRALAGAAASRPEDLLDETALLAALERLQEDGGWEDPTLRRLLAEVGRAMAAAEAEGLPAPSRSVRDAALAAYAALAPPPDAPERRRRARAAVGTVARPRRRGAPLLRAAACLLLGVALAWTLTSAPPAARAGLRLRAVDRIQPARGTCVLRGARLAPVGETIRAGEGEALVLRLEGGGVVLLGAGDLLSVAQEGGAALLRLEEGGAALRCGDVPLRLSLRGRGVLALGRGEARVRLAGDGPPLLDLAPGARAALEGDPAPAEGPGRFRLDPRGAESLGPPGPDAFAVLDRYGAGRAGPRREHHVAVRRWRIARGPARRLGSGLRLGRRPGGEAPAVAWAPSEHLGAATRLRLRLEGAPEGTRVRALVPDPHEAAVREGEADLALPSGWHARLDGGELVLEFVFPPASTSPAEASCVLASTSFAFVAEAGGEGPSPAAAGENE